MDKFLELYKLEVMTMIVMLADKYIPYLKILKNAIGSNTLN